MTDRTPRFRDDRGGLPRVDVGTRQRHRCRRLRCPPVARVGRV